MGFLYHHLLGFPAHLDAVEGVEVGLLGLLGYFLNEHQLLAGVEQVERGLRAHVDRVIAVGVGVG